MKRQRCRSLTNQLFPGNVPLFRGIIERRRSGSRCASSCDASLSPIMSPREEGGGAGTLLRSLSRCVWHLTRRLPSVVTDFSLTFLLFVSTLPDSRRNVFRYIRWKDALARSYFGSYLSFKRYNGIIRVDWIGKYLFVISLKIWLDIYKKYINICDSKP